MIKKTGSEPASNPPGKKSDTNLGNLQNTSRSEKQVDNIAEIMRERNRIDQFIHENFKKEITILFTDICGYTQYMDAKADINGMMMLQRHNDIVIPIVEQNKGVVIKMIGDAVMASFPEPLEAVNAAIDIQKSLEVHNQTQEESEEIHVKIGINTGVAIIDQSDIFGDAVNVASRIQSQAGKDQILISKTLYERISNIENINCKFHSNAKVKGKSKQLELYEVFWQQGTVDADQGKVRAGSIDFTPDQKSSPKIIQLDLTRHDQYLKIGAHDQSNGQMDTIQYYEEVPITIEKLDARCRDIVKTLNNANRRGLLARAAMNRLREIGQAFYNELFTSDVKEKLKKSSADHLILNMDESLVHIPWELLYDGKVFLCQQFNMGRLVKTRQEIVGLGERLIQPPVNLMILADPGNDLEGAHHEGSDLLDFFRKNQSLINASLKSDAANLGFIKNNIKNYDMVHFAGHADYSRENPERSGWRLTDGTFKASEIKKIAETSVMPVFIFSNACQSALTEDNIIGNHFHNEIFGLANAFILSGVKHYVGTFWEILDEPSRFFALEFYKFLFSDITIGEALKKARTALIEKYGEESIVWASYILYGDPSFKYNDHIRGTAKKDANETPVTNLVREEPHEHVQVVHDSPEKKKSKNLKRFSLAAGVIIVLFAMLYWYTGFQNNTILKYEQAAITSYNSGNIQEALALCETVKNKRPEHRLPYLIEGDIFLGKGQLAMAQTSYQKAIDASSGTDPDKARALMGLGRIASLNHKAQDSIDYYQKATTAYPESEAGYLAQAMVLDNQGNSEQALSILKNARQIIPDNRALTLMTNDIHQKVSLAEDTEKQDKINQLVKELLERMESPSRAIPSDGWTSKPLTLWMMDFQTNGYALQEGKDRMIASGIADQMIQYQRVRIVERALLDKLLGELKFGSSQLIDQRAALSLGKILAARLILFSQIDYSETHTRVSMRLIETETGLVSAAISESFGNSMPTSRISDEISTELLTKLEKKYPLQARISEVTDDRVKINIGRHSGVINDHHFRVMNQDVLLKVISVDQNTSYAEFVKGDQTQVAEGLRIVAELEAH